MEIKDLKNKMYATLQNNIEHNSMDTEQERKRPKIKKSLEQQVAAAQMRLTRLQHKSKSEAKQIETRQKIILGAEVAKALDCDVFTVDKELVIGMLNQQAEPLT